MGVLDERGEPTFYFVPTLSEGTHLVCWFALGLGSEVGWKVVAARGIERNK